MNSIVKSLAVAAIAGLGFVGSAQAADLGGDRNTFGREFGSAFSQGSIGATVRIRDAGGDRNAHLVDVIPAPAAKAAATDAPARVFGLSLNVNRGVYSG